MGAIDIYYTVDGTLSESKVRAAHEKRLDDNRRRNGHQEGYSGDWQTIAEIDFYPDKVFKNFQEAYDHCSSQCEKWSGMAVKFRGTDDSEYRKDKTWIKAYENVKESWEKVREEENKLRQKRSQLFEELKEAKSKKITCKTCDSSLSRAHLKNSNCPLCDTELLSATALTQIERCEERINKAKLEHNKLVEKADQIKEKINEANGQTSWLVYGLAAT